MSEGTFFYWRPRFEVGGYEALEQFASHAPKEPNRTSVEIEQEVITLRRREIALSAKTRIQAILDRYDSGIEIVTVELQGVNPPLNVRDSFNEVNRAIQEKQTSINEARRDWNKEIPTATGEAEKMLQSAEGYKTKRINEALGDVARFSLLLEEYTKAKDVTRVRLYLEAFEEVLPRTAQIFIVDGKQDGPLQVLDLKSAAGARSTLKPKPDTGAKQNPSPRSRQRSGR